MRWTLSVLLGVCLVVEAGPVWAQELPAPRPVAVRQSGRVVVHHVEGGRGEVPTSQARAVWQGVGIAGSVLLTVGTLAVVAGLLQSFDSEEDRSSEAYIIGLVGIGSGLVLTPLGWTMYAQTSRREKRERRELEQQAPRPHAAPGFRLSFSF